MNDLALARHRRQKREQAERDAWRGWLDEVLALQAEADKAGVPYADVIVPLTPDEL
jgi:hypothetical protein